MFRGRFLGLVLAALLVLALLIGGASAIQRDAWTQGYMIGRLSTGTDGGSAMPLLPYGYPGAYPGARPAGGGFGLVFGIGLLVLLFLVVGRLFQPRQWAMHGGPGCPPWPRAQGSSGGPAAGHWHHGSWGWGQPPETASPKQDAGAEVSAPKAEK